jgi:2-keto-4-pentenoate hydratase/2-oxohepta-3-ene-1,7-dioic acid hydratase in catechol pathway
MKLVSYETPCNLGRSIGALIDGKIIDLNAGYVLYLKETESEATPYRLANVRVPPSMLGFLQGEEKSMEAAKKTIAYINGRLKKGEMPIGPKGEKLVYNRNEVRLLAPVPRPNTLRDWLCFEEHLKMGAEKLGKKVPELWYKLPECYKGNPCTVIGTDDEIWWPSWEGVNLDYECELGMYIGKKGRDIPLDDASKYIAGYTIFNDVSDRTIETKEISLWIGPGKGKDFDHGNVMGPCMVTPDELDFRSIKTTVRINGEFQVEGYAKDMFWSWKQLIEHASKSMTLYPGDFFGSGTIGRGCGMDMGRTLKPGDIIEIEATGIGILRNKVVKK